MNTVVNTVMESLNLCDLCVIDIISVIVLTAGVLISTIYVYRQITSTSQMVCPPIKPPMVSILTTKTTRNKIGWKNSSEDS
jgi:hypothetical protein